MADPGTPVGRFRVMSGDKLIAEGSSWLTPQIEHKQYRHELMFGTLTIEGDEAACVKFSELISVLIARGVIKYNATP